MNFVEYDSKLSHVDNITRFKKKNRTHKIRTRNMVIAPCSSGSTVKYRPAIVGAIDSGYAYCYCCTTTIHKLPQNVRKLLVKAPKKDSWVEPAPFGLICVPLNMCFPIKKHMDKNDFNQLRRNSKSLQEQLKL